MMMFEVKRHHVFKKRLGVSMYHPDFLKGEGGEGLKSVCFLYMNETKGEKKTQVTILATCVSCTPKHRNVEPLGGLQKGSKIHR